MLDNEKSVKEKERRKQDVQICVWGEYSQYAHMHVAQCHNKIIRGCEKAWAIGVDSKRAIGIMMKMTL